MRKRVSAVTFQETSAGLPQQATYYSYDQLGNVKTLWQQIQDLGVKRIDYQYDLVSGKVNKVRYQKDSTDRFYYNYEYDAENRLIKAGSGINSTSADGWEIENAKTDAGYRYYLHGPLARMELGNTALVQGLDYAYTLQGWLKGVNGNYLSAANDMGKDGVVGTPRAVVGRDAYAYTLDYFNGDYQPIGASPTAFTLTWDSLQGDVMGRNLYSGNISRSTLALSNINAGASVGYTYRYDQLNRLTAMRQQSIAAGANTWNILSTGLAYKEDVSYDGNGNILKYVRYGSGASGKGLPMDSLKYIYPRDASGYLTSNRLTQVQDSVIGDAYTDDLSNQPVNNYLYDNIGNLIKDTSGDISNIQWTVYGKIKTITKADGSSLEYRYDPSGNRIYKAYTHAGITDKTWYVRDVQGNTLSIYGNKDGGSTLYWKEQQLYGSSRLGIWEPNITVGTNAGTIWDNIGLKRYELSNHLGNVLAAISDKAVLEGDHYKAELLSAQDYYPFGMLQPDRSYSLGTYRYGFNGQEKSDEIAGRGNHTTATFWEYDSRTGRRWNRDPEPIVEESEYATNANNPIKNSDPNGDTPGPGDRTTGSVGLTMNLGTHNNKVSLKFSVTQQLGNFSLSAGGGISAVGTFNNTGKSGLELRGSAMGGFDNGKSSVQLGTNVFQGLGGMSEFKQRTGILSVKVGDFSASYENDGYPFPKLKLGDNGDRYRTAAVRIGVGEFSAGFNLFTGSRTNYREDAGKVGKMETGDFGERMPNGFVQEDGSKYRMGAVFLGYGNTKIGITSDRYVRHPIQDMFAHNLKHPDTRQPGFRSLSNNITPYFQSQTPNIFNTATPKRFSLYE